MKTKSLLLVLLLALLLPVTAGAVTVQTDETIGNYIYDLYWEKGTILGESGRIATLKGIATSAILTNAVFPATVTYDGDEYRVVTIGDGTNPIDPQALLRSVKLGSNVSTIAANAFRNSSNMTSIVLDDGLKRIGNYAFYGCSKLATIKTGTNGVNGVLPSSLISIGSYAFFYCKKLSTVTIPENVPTIGSYAFKNCTALTTVNLNEGLTKINQQAFYGCTQLVTIGTGVDNTNGMFPTTLTTIGSSAFYGCTALTHAVLPNNCTSLGKSAFKGCSSLFSYSFGGVTAIPESAYEGAGIGYLSLGRITSVGSKAFKDCTNLSTVEVFTSMQSIATDAFEGCDPDQVQYNILKDGSITTVADSLFYGCSGVGKLTFQDGITAIGVEAFSYCPTLFSVTMTTSVQTIDETAFTNGCPFGLYINPSETTTRITNNLFKNRTSLKNVFIGDGVETIGYAAFSGTDIHGLIIPQSVYDISGNAFYNCYSLNRVEVYTGTAIASEVFDKDFETYPDASMIEMSIYPKQTNTVIPEEWFMWGCNAVETVNIEDGITAIEQKAFKGCSNLSEVYMTTSVRTIGDCAFQDMAESVDFYIDPSVKGEKDIAVNFMAKTNYGSSDVPCNTPYGIHIGNGVTAIGESAFANPEEYLKVVDIPVTVENIGLFAFANATGLESVEVQWTEPIAIPSNNPPFNNRYRTVLHVPYGCKRAYDYASNEDYFYCWKGFKSVRERPSVQWGDFLFTLDVNTHTAALMEFVGEQRRQPDMTLYIPETITALDGETYTVTKIGYSAFWTDNVGGCEFGYVIIPYTVTEIDENAFRGFVTNQALNIPSSVTYIGTQSFYGANLSEIYIPTSVTYIGPGAFNAVTWNEGAEVHVNWMEPLEILEGTFGWETITNVPLMVPAGTRSLYAAAQGWDVFSTIYETSMFTDALGITYLYNNGKAIVTDFCGGAGYVEIPASITIGETVYPVTEINNNAFYGAATLRNVVIPASVTSIGHYAFRNLAWAQLKNPEPIDVGVNSDPFPSLNVLWVPAHTKAAYAAHPYWGRFTIEEVAPIWENIDINGLSYYYDPDPNYPDALVCGYNNDIPTDVVIPATIEVNDTTYTVKGIDVSAFNFSAMESLVIPTTVETIERGAFNNCTNLTDVYVGWMDPSVVTLVSDYVFHYMGSATLHVPAGTRSLYANAAGWKDFGTIVETPVSITLAREALGYSSAVGLDFTNVENVKAYIVSGYTDEGKVLLSRVNIVPPYTGIYLKATQSGCTIEVPSTDRDIYYANLLEPLVEAQTIQPTEVRNGEEYTNFVVGVIKDTGKVGFIRVKSPSTVGPNRVVLPVPSRLYTAASRSALEVIFDDQEATGIEDYNHESVTNSSDVYDLQGRKISSDQLRKGVYIVNGKKVFIK